MGWDVVSPEAGRGRGPLPRRLNMGCGVWGSHRDAAAHGHLLHGSVVLWVLCDELWDPRPDPPALLGSCSGTQRGSGGFPTETRVPEEGQGSC